VTDARFPDRWLNDRRVVRLSDSAFRTFVTTLTWSVSNRTDGFLERDDLELVRGANERDVTALVASGLWGTSGDDFVITDFRATQTSRSEHDVLENVRRGDREKKARQRANRDSDSPSPEQSPGTASPGNFPRDRIGQDRTGRKDRKDRHLGPAHLETGLDDDEIDGGLMDYRTEYRGGPVPWDDEESA
jgi:hypothetical protein